MLAHPAAAWGLGQQLPTPTPSPPHPEPGAYPGGCETTLRVRTAQGGPNSRLRGKGVPTD